MDVGQLTQKPTHPKTNSPKNQLTQVVTNSPKYISQLTQVFGQLTQVLTITKNTLDFFFV